MNSCHELLFHPKAIQPKSLNNVTQNLVGVYLMGSRYSKTASLPKTVNHKNLHMVSSWIEMESNSILELGLDIKLTKANITIGEGSELRIGGMSEIRGRIIVAPGCKVIIGEGLICNGDIKIHASENSNVIIGKDCLFANPQLLSSDMHSIFAENGERINYSRDILLGDRVWLATNALILKGAQISNDTVVGAGAVVSGRHPSNVVIGGNPAKIIKSGITWSRFLVAGRPVQFGDNFSQSSLSLAARESRHKDVLAMGMAAWSHWSEMDISNHYIFYYLAKSLLLTAFTKGNSSAIVNGYAISLRDIYDCLILSFELTNRRNFPCAAYAYLAAQMLGLSDGTKSLYNEVKQSWSHIDGSNFKFSG
ncbi:hexapeptide repeat family transferase [Pseudomonas sp. XWY-1]|nr:hexapeptide repeat family transferase [Pseudomonas sp. XWY-1]